jgi:hypothetical protein
MKKQIVQISIVQSAKVAAALYLVTSVPILAALALFTSILSTQVPGGAVVGVAILVAVPALYGFCAFVGAVIAAAIYNLVAARIGGFEFTTAEVGTAAVR